MEKRELVKDFKFEAGQIHRLLKGWAYKVVFVTSAGVVLLREDGYRLTAVNLQVYEGASGERYIEWEYSIQGHFTNELWCAK
ncbi:MAG: hypothetical protein RR234_00970 [Christensenella sp.]